MNQPSDSARPQRQRITVFGVPTDIGASHRGASMGPEALRVAGIGQALRALGHDVLDRGDVRGPRNPGQAPVDGYRHLDQVVSWNRAVLDRSARELAAGRIPLMLGGDHSIAVGSIAAVARHCRRHGRALRVLWLDAHADFNTREITPSGNLHGMPVASLCGLGPSALSSLGGQRPAIRPDQVRQIGVRSVDEGEGRLADDLQLPMYGMAEVAQLGIDAVMDRALDGVDAQTHVHVSFDVDMLDPSIAPGTGTTVDGGIDLPTAQAIMRRIAATGSLGSLDVVEVNPALDLRNATARMAVGLVALLFGRA